MMRDELDRYDELVLTCDGEQFMRVALTAPRRRMIARLWTVLEAELGRQLELDEVIAEACRLTIAKARG